MIIPGPITRDRLQNALNVLARIMAGDNDEDADAIAPIFDRLEIRLEEMDEESSDGSKPSRPKRKPWHQMGETPTVYFFKSGDYIKIGKSTGWRNRRAALQTGSPHPMIPLLVLRANRNTERALQDQFKRHHVNGEWYRPAAEILAYIEEHKADSLPLEASP